MFDRAAGGEQPAHRDDLPKLGTQAGKALNDLGTGGSKARVDLDAMTADADHLLGQDRIGG